MEALIDLLIFAGIIGGFIYSIIGTAIFCDFLDCNSYRTNPRWKGWIKTVLVGIVCGPITWVLLVIIIFVLVVMFVLGKIFKLIDMI